MLSQTRENNVDMIDFHGAALVDQQGCEIPITPDMVDNALQQANDFLCPEQGIWAPVTNTSN